METTKFNGDATHFANRITNTGNDKTTQGMTPSFWLTEPLLRGTMPGATSRHPHKQSGSIIVIGSGLAGTSVGYHLQEAGFSDVVILDDTPEKSASYRNCGHILYGTVESMLAMVELHGEKKAKELWQFSIDICNMVENTAKRLDLDMDYKREGYLVIADNETEDQECQRSVALLNRMGFQSDYVSAQEIAALGFQNCHGARYESGSASAHPVKFRNGLMNRFLKKGGRYYSGLWVHNVEETPDGVIVHTNHGTWHGEAAVIAANAYSPLFSDFFKSHGLIEPFRGQIITSAPLKHEFKVKYPHSFDHGYEYALVTKDNRLMIGGWRQNSATGEVGLYSLDTNPLIEQGLKDFVKTHYVFAGDEPKNTDTGTDAIDWEFSWSGIMGASKTGLPFIGNTSSPRIYCCGGFTGHGFSWAHGSAHLLAQIIAGQHVPDVAKYFNPKTAL